MRNKPLDICLAIFVTPAVFSFILALLISLFSDINFKDSFTFCYIIIVGFFVVNIKKLF